MTEARDPEEEQPRGPGRPRKWADDAERVRAYRARKAAEQADVDLLRRDRRGLRRQVAELLRKLDKAERAAANATDRAGRLTAELDAAREKLRTGALEADRLHQAIAAVRLKYDPWWADRDRTAGRDAQPPSAPVPAGPSRAERRALERRSRRR